MHLKKPEFTYKSCGSFTKHRERTQKFREAVKLKCLYKNELDKAYTAYSDSKCLA